MPADARRILSREGIDAASIEALCNLMERNFNADYGSEVASGGDIVRNSPLPTARQPTVTPAPALRDDEHLRLRAEPRGHPQRGVHVQLQLLRDLDVPQPGRELHGHHHIPGFGQRQHEHLHQHGNDVGSEPERFRDLRSQRHVRRER